MSGTGPHHYLSKGGPTAGPPQHYYGSIDETPAAHFKQPPPAYVEPPPAYVGDDETVLRGGIPRSSVDNVLPSQPAFPREVRDDFKFGGVIAKATVAIRNAFVRKVYSILTAQLIATTALSTIIALYNPSFKHWIQLTNGWMVFVSVFGALALMLAMFWNRKEFPANLLWLSGFTVAEAYAVAVAVCFYEVTFVLEAVVIAGALFAVLTLFACQTKYELTSWYGVLYGSLWFLIIFGLVAMFFPGTWMELACAELTAVLFSAYILVDTGLSMDYMHEEEEIVAAITFYLDIIKLFLAIAKILDHHHHHCDHRW